MPESNDAIVGMLAQDPRKALARLYQDYEQSYLAFIRGYGGSRDEQIDSFHDALLGFFEMYVAGRYDPARASVKTLIYTIGKYRLLTALGKKSREPLSEDLSQAVAVVEEAMSEPGERLSAVIAAMSALGDQCQKIIALFYYGGLSIREIVEKLGYKNENVVKAHKSRCMKTLRDLVTGEENSTIKGKL